MELFNLPSEPHCSFCGTKKSETRAMLKSAEGLKDEYICFSCILKCKAALNNSPNTPKDIA